MLVRTTDDMARRWRACIKAPTFGRCGLAHMAPARPLQPPPAQELWHEVRAREVAEEEHNERFVERSLAEEEVHSVEQFDPKQLSRDGYQCRNRDLHDLDCENQRNPVPESLADLI